MTCDLTTQAVTLLPWQNTNGARVRLKKTFHNKVFADPSDILHIAPAVVRTPYTHTMMSPPPSCSSLQSQSLSDRQSCRSSRKPSAPHVYPGTEQKKIKVILLGSDRPAFSLAHTHAASISLSQCSGGVAIPCCGCRIDLLQEPLVCLITCNIQGAPRQSSRGSLQPPPSPKPPLLPTATHHRLLRPSCFYSPPIFHLSISRPVFLTPTTTHQPPTYHPDLTCQFCFLCT